MSDVNEPLDTMNMGRAGVLIERGICSKLRDEVEQLRIKLAALKAEPPRPAVLCLDRMAHVYADPDEAKREWRAADINKYCRFFDVDVVAWHPRKEGTDGTADDQTGV